MYSQSMLLCVWLFAFGIISLWSIDIGSMLLYVSVVLRFNCWIVFPCWASQVTLVVKNLPANAGDLRDMGLIPGLEEGMATHSSILVWRIPWTEEPGTLQSIGSLRDGHNWSNWTHYHIPLQTGPWFLDIWGYFWFLATINKATKNILIYCFQGHISSFFLSKYIDIM